MKMLAWPNGKRRCGFRVYIGLIHMQETKRRRKAPLRRRNRARENAEFRREVAQLRLSCSEIGCYAGFHDYAD